MYGKPCPANHVPLVILSPAFLFCPSMSRRPRLPRIVDQLPRDLVRHVRHGPAKFPTRAFLRSRPDHVSVGIDQPDRSRRFVTPLVTVARFAVRDPRSRILVG